MVNKAMLIGNLGSDPEMRYTPGGTAVARFSVATSERYKDKAGQVQEKTEWHRVVAFGRLGEICGEYLTKGARVYIGGRIQTRQWEKDGQTHYSTEIVAGEMKMLDRKGDGASGGANRPAKAAAKPASDAGDPPADDFVDDIPF